MTMDAISDVLADIISALNRLSLVLAAKTLLDYADNTPEEQARALQIMKNRMADKRPL